MAISRVRPCAWVCAALAANILLLSSQALAQLGGGGGLGGGGLGGGGLGGGLGGGAGGGGTIGSQGGSGVVIDADGVLRTRHFRDPTGRLTRQRLLEARAALDRDVAQASRLRKISLVRLEAALRDRLERNAGLTETMRCMAGLTRIQYVFYYPQTRDIVLAGPAEGWGEDLSGRTIGLQSGRPTILLEDLLVALRAFPPTGASTPAIYCSIDPTPEGLTRMQQFLRRVGSRATPSDTQFIVAGLRNSLGPQKVTIGGVPASSHFAQVLVEADYRMKLIGIGLEQPPVKLTSYVARANPAAVSRNALERWYFVPNYECVRVSEDTLAMELVGLGVKLISESELVGQDGGRTSARRTNRASQMFVGEFTRKYPALAARAPVFAQLRNMIDLAVAAAFIQQQDYYSQAAWTLGVLGDEQILPVETLPAPRFAETAVNSLWKGNRLMTPIGGGVQIRPTQALDPDRILPDDDRLVAAARGEVELSALEDLQWWWD